jgi:hypothetical protein
MTGTVRKVAPPKKPVKSQGKHEPKVATAPALNSLGFALGAGAPTPTVKTKTQRINERRKARAAGKAPKKPVLPKGSDSVTSADSDAWTIWDYNPDWSLEQAQAANEQIPAEFQHYPGAPFFRWAAHTDITAQEAEYERQADGWLLISAMQRCASARIPMPPWVAKAWLEASRAMVEGLAASWDDVLPKPYRKGISLKTVIQRRNIAPLAWRAITNEIGSNAPGAAMSKGSVTVLTRVNGKEKITSVHRVIAEEKPLTKAVYEKVGKNMGLSRAKTEELYQYENRKRIATMVSGVLSGIKREMTERYGPFEAGWEPSTRYPAVKQEQIERVAKLYRTHKAAVTQIWDALEAQS